MDHAKKLAGAFDFEITLFQVLPFISVYGAPELMTPFMVDEKTREGAEKYLRDLSEELRN